MDGAVFYATRYGSTREYARWIAEATGLSVHDIEADAVDLKALDFLVIGLPVIYHKLYGARWILRNLEVVQRKPLILFTVSGAPPGDKLDGWIADSLPREVIDHMQHFALRGRQTPRELSLYDRMMLIIGSLMNPDRQAAREELHGFDFVDRDSIQPIISRIEGLRQCGACRELAT